MYEHLNDLVDDLLKIEQDFSKYKNSKDARAILQDIKVESQNLRVKINEAHKASK